MSGTGWPGDSSRVGESDGTMATGPCDGLTDSRDRIGEYRAAYGELVVLIAAVVDPIVRPGEYAAGDRAGSPV